MQMGGNAILEAFDSGKWKIYRENQRLKRDQYEKLVGPNSIDVTLSPHILSQKIPSSNLSGIIDPWDEHSLYWEPLEIDKGQSYILHPRKFILSCTRERIDCNEPIFIDGKHRKFVQAYDGRSTMGRLGVASHVTAGFGDYGFRGAFTLEFFCQEHPIKLRPNMRIGQIYITETENPIPYGGAYNGMDHFNKPHAPKIGKDRF